MGCKEADTTEPLHNNQRWHRCSTRNIFSSFYTHVSYRNGYKCRSKRKVVVVVGIVASAAVAIDAAVVVMQVGIVTVAAVLIVAALGVAVAKSTVVVKGVSSAVASGILMLPVVPFAVAYVVAGAIIVATVAIGMVLLGRTVVAVAEVQTMRSVDWR